MFEVDVNGRPVKIHQLKMNQNSNRWRIFLVGALLVGATMATFWPVFHNDFINYDDPDYVTANEVIQNGLAREGVKWAATNHRTREQLAPGHLDLAHAGYFPVWPATDGASCNYSLFPRQI